MSDTDTITKHIYDLCDYDYFFRCQIVQDALRDFDRIIIYIPHTHTNAQEVKQQLENGAFHHLMETEIDTVYLWEKPQFQPQTEEKNMETIETLVDAFPGEVIAFVYHGGSNPGETRVVRVESKDTARRIINGFDIAREDYRSFSSHLAENIRVIKGPVKTPKMPKPLPKTALFHVTWNDGTPQKEVENALNETMQQFFLVPENSPE